MKRFAAALIALLLVFAVSCTRSDTASGSGGNIAVRKRKLLLYLLRRIGIRIFAFARIFGRGMGRGERQHTVFHRCRA